VSLHPPHVRQYVPPSDEAMAESRAALAQRRAEQDAAREAARPARRAAVLAGPALRDVDAAVDCWCSCHPRPADPGLHDGGRSCGCQDSEEDRVARIQAFRDLLDDLDEDTDGASRYYDEQRHLVAAEAEALGVEARIEAWWAPHVVVGVCDGRGFYLRERHGSYQVTIAADDDPGSDPWRAEPTVPSIDIAAGDECELEEGGAFSWVVAVRVAVRAVRTALARNTCEHRRVGAEPFCPSCGVRLADADAWRWTTVRTDDPT